MASYVFAATKGGVSNSELWITDGTEDGTKLVKELVAGSSQGGNPQLFTPFGDKVVFNATGGTWITDGTGEGTKLLTSTRMSSAFDLGDGRLLFSNNSEGLFVIDGETVTQIKAFPLSANLRLIGSKDGLAVFKAPNPQGGAAVFWVTDGTEDGTEVYLDPATQEPVLAGSYWAPLVDNDDALEMFVTSGTELFRLRIGADIFGDAVSVTPIMEYEGHPQFQGATTMVSMGEGKIVFQQSNGYGLWISDGTEGGTYKLNSDLTYFIQGASLGDGRAIVRSNTEVWVVTETSATRLVQNLQSLKEFTAFGEGKVLFIDAGRAWVSDGTIAGTFQLPPMGNVTDFTIVGDKAWFAAANGVLYETDGTIAGTRAIVDPDPFTIGGASGKLAQVTPPPSNGPQLTSAVIEDDLITLIYDKALDPNIEEGWLSTRFKVKVEGVAAHLSSVEVDAAARTVKLNLETPVRAGQDVSITYIDPTAGDESERVIQAVDGTDAPDIRDRVVTNKTVDTKPVVVSMEASGYWVRLEFDRDLDNGSIDADHFLLTVNGEVVEVGSVLIGADGLVELSIGVSVEAGDEVVLTYTDPSSGDDGNALQSRSGVDVDSFTQVIEGVVVPPELINATANGDSVYLLFSQTMDDAVLPPAGSLVVRVAGQPVAVTDIFILGSEVNLTLAQAVTPGQAVFVEYTDPTSGDDVQALQSLDGADVETFAGTVVNTTQAARPRLVSGTVDGASVVVTFNAPLDATLGDISDLLRIRVDQALVSIDSAQVSGSQLVITLSEPVKSGHWVTFAYMDPTSGDDARALQSVAGVDVESIQPRTLDNTTSPQFLSASITGSALVMTFDSELNPDVADIADQFTVRVGGVEVAIHEIQIADDVVTIMLDAPVAHGATVQVSYSDPTAGDDEDALQNTVGVDVPTLPLTTVTNNTPPPAPIFVSATVEGATLVMTFDSDLDAAVSNIVDQFAVRAAGAVVGVDAVQIAGRQVTLTLAAPVTSGQSVQVGYADPTIGDDVNALQGLTGVDVATLQLAAVANNTPPSTHPVLVSATVNGAGLTLSFDRDLDVNVGDIADLFVVEVGGGEVDINSLHFSGRQVTLGLVTPATAGQTVRIAYTDPTAGNDAVALQGRDGVDVASFPSTVVTNNTPQPNPNPNPQPQPNPGQNPPPSDPVATQDGRDEAFQALGGVAPDSPKAAQPTVTLDDGTVVTNRNAERAERFEALSEAFQKGEINREVFIESLVETQLDTTGAAVMVYQFFTGSAPNAGGVSWLVDNPNNDRDLTDAYYAKFSSENVFINLAASLGGEGAGREAFQADYGALDFTQAVTKAYGSVIGVAAARAAGIDVDKAIAYVASQQAYFEALAGSSLGGKAAMVGYLMSAGLKAEVGIYNDAIRDFMAGIIEGDAEYGEPILSAASTVGLVGIAGWE